MFPKDEWVYLLLSEADMFWVFFFEVTAVAL